MTYSTPHPDTHLHQQQVRSITQGGMQAADTAAMEAMKLALNEGKSKEEAGKIFSKTYQQVIYGMDKMQR